MSWTVACFCGNLHSTAPHGRCPSCGESLPDVMEVARDLEPVTHDPFIDDLSEIGRPLDPSWEPVLALAAVVA